MESILPPFYYTYSPRLPAILWDMQCTLIVSTYQAGQVMFITAATRHELDQKRVSFSKPMGVAVSETRIAVAAQDEVLVLSNPEGERAAEPRPAAEVGDTLAPEATYATSQSDTHDVVWGKDGLWAVNTRASTLGLIGASGFEPRWRPPFVSNPAPEDRCHLNGVAMQDGQPQYATAFGRTDTQEGWRNKKTSGGVLLDVPTGEVVVGDLPMPHSPRVYDDELYMLLSATGEVVRVDRARGGYEVVSRLPGFVRGMARQGDYLFVGLSKIRTSSATFGDLPIAETSQFCGIAVIDFSNGQTAAHLRYETGVEEIYDVQISPGLRGPESPASTGDQRYAQ